MSRPAPGRSARKRSLIAAFLLSLAPGVSADPEVDPDALPRFPPKSPSEALDTFALKPGFKIELAASEPLTEDPIAISFDEHGRMFICEMRGYSERRDEARGRIRMLTDDDGDGAFDRATTYAGGLKWPTALICWDGGVFVGATPDIWYFKDTTGDGVADRKEIVFTGFAKGASRLNVQGLMNNFAIGPDLRIYGATAHHGGSVTRPDVANAKPVNLRGRDFSFDPNLRDLRPECGTAQYGLTFDDDGLRYVCSNSSHIETVIYSWPFVGASLPNPLVKIPVDGGAAEVFRTSPVEPWRIVRTRWRVQGKVKGPIEGGGRAAGYFTSASGLCVYRGHAFPPEFRGNIFVGDVGSNLVHRKIVTKNNNRIQVTAARPNDEQKTEFLTSTDTWFRPVMCQNGPGGALYIVDMYRETIEHPWSLPPAIKSQLDLNSGHDRGRIWRILPNTSTNPPTPKTNRAASLWSAASTNKLDPKSIVTALADQDPIIRQTAIRLANKIPVLPHHLPPLASDKNPWVRFELALYLTKPENSIPDPLATFATLAEYSKSDPWIHHAVAEAASKRNLIGPLFVSLFSTDQAWVAPLLHKLTAKATPADTKAIFEAMGMANDIDRIAELLETLPHRPDKDTLRPLIEKAKASDSPNAIKLLALDPNIPAGRFWRAVEENTASSSTALGALMRRSPDWKTEALTRWQNLPTNARDTVLKNLSPMELLAAVEAGSLTASEVPLPTKAALRSHKESAIQKRAHAALGPADPRTRKEIAAHFRPALDLEGDPAKGEKTFAARCALCHEPAGSNEKNAGPALNSFQNKDAALILENLISPNAEFAPQFSAWKVETEDGDTHLGLLERETADTITLRLPGRLAKTIPRKKIRTLANQNQSLMPVGLESGLTLPQMADLLAFLTQIE